ncbi:carbon-nitrogen hydrolase [Xylariaceae sp. FL0255]|nr:carbon-nitrogen hydrolase [Xylariaceae sp. FL0255]
MAKAAIGQICSSNSMTHNLAQCVKLVGQAASAGAKVLFLPEASDYIATSAQESLSLAQPISSSPFVTGLQEAAAKHSIAVHVGIHVPSSTPTTLPSSSSTAPKSSSSPPSTKLYNRTIYISPTGSINPSHSYDKLHLFDYAGANLLESASTQSGSSFTPPIPSPVGYLGSQICFDMRFPEPAIHLTKSRVKEEGTSESEKSPTPAQILLYPSAFTVPTGRAHWEVLLRARAIETQSWVIAAAQVGAHNYPPLPPSPTSSSQAPATTTTTTTKRPRISYGHSLVVDPWGRVVLEMKGVKPDWDVNDDDPLDAVEEGAVGELGIVDIDLEEWDRVRERMPLMRRTDIYPEV